MTNQDPATSASRPLSPDADWWRRAVVYQIYPRSFADADNDGTGDIAGMISRLDYLAWLGVDAIWVSPWYPSPLLDGGYDVADYRDISPDFGTLAQADEFVAAAHERGLRVLVDLVPNHSSWEHPWFREALAAPPGSPERERYIFRDGRGADGELPPNNWVSVFGGSAWTRITEADGVPGQWYLHLFDTSQPDWNWENEAIREEFDAILRFWFDRGVDGFRIDVADSMVKAPGLPDLPTDPETGEPVFGKNENAPQWDRPEVADIQRRWRAVADEYADTELGARVFVAEAYLDPVERLVRYVESDRLHTTFNFDALLCEWTAHSQRHMIENSLRAHERVGAPACWVLGNHDNARVATRYGKPLTGRDFTVPVEVAGEAVAMKSAMAGMPTDIELGRRRARAAALLELALPGVAYIYQGEELGLAEVEDLPEESLQDPIWERSGHTARGRDGCRVPLPWSGNAAPFGFSRDAVPWLPQPAYWDEFTVEHQSDDPASMLTLYRLALRTRREVPDLATADLVWQDFGAEVLAFTRGRVLVVVNFGSSLVRLPNGEVLVASQIVESGELPAEAAAWLLLG